MDRATADQAIIMFLAEIRDQLDSAAGIARAAYVCAAEGNVDKAVDIALDVEQLAYEVGTLLNAASLIKRKITT